MRRKINIKELIIIAVILLIGIAAFVLFENIKQNGKTAVISVNGNIVKEINLEQADNCTFNPEETENITFEIKDGKIRVTSSDCPDKICKNTGFISDTGESIICMPNKMIVEIKD